jgi:hypothetical protein
MRRLVSAMELPIVRKQFMATTPSRPSTDGIAADAGIPLLLSATRCRTMRDPPSYACGARSACRPAPSEPGAATARSAA